MSYALGGEAAYYQPPAPPGPECQWCDGNGIVDVAAIRDSAGKFHEYNGADWAHIPCPRCLELPGVEPIIEKEVP